MGMDRGRRCRIRVDRQLIGSPRVSVGVGGRYWAMWVPDGTTIFVTGVAAAQRFAAEQAAVFLQASYKFGVPCCAGLFQ
jgi:hypothetical protein